MPGWFSASGMVRGVRGRPLVGDRGSQNACTRRGVLSISAEGDRGSLKPSSLTLLLAEVCVSLQFRVRGVPSHEL